MTIEECRVGNLVIGNVRANNYGITTEGFIGEITEIIATSIRIRQIWTEEELTVFLISHNPSHYKILKATCPDWYERGIQYGWVVNPICFDHYETGAKDIKLSDYLL